MQQFIKELKKRKGHILEKIAIKGGKMLFYRENGDYATSSRIKSFIIYN